MPWTHVWEPNPSDESLEVRKELPEGCEASDWGRPKRAYLSREGVVNQMFYECMWCEGWIEGSPYEYNEDTLGPLCGRRGTVSSCRRCGREIGFEGMMS